MNVVNVAYIVHFITDELLLTILYVVLSGIRVRPTTISFRNHTCQECVTVTEPLVEWEVHSEYQGTA